MPNLNLGKMNPAAAKKIKPFFDDIAGKYLDKLHSIHVTGTALTDDYDEKLSDVNSIFVLKQMDLKFLELLAPLGKKYGKSGVAAPLIMTPDYIEKSLDVFPIEFLNFKLIHSTVYGEDNIENIEINRMDLRHQCERELKAKLIWLRQGYISSAGDRKILTESFVNAIKGYIPLFRGIIALFGNQPPLKQVEVITALSKTVNSDTGVFSRVLQARHEKTKFSVEELNTIFEDYYTATERLGNIVDEITE